MKPSAPKERAGARTGDERRAPQTLEEKPDAVRRSMAQGRPVRRVDAFALCRIGGREARHYRYRLRALQSSVDAAQEQGPVGTGVCQGRGCDPLGPNAVFEQGAGISQRRLARFRLERL